jgi:hypothetical protein
VRIPTNKCMQDLLEVSKGDEISDEHLEDFAKCMCHDQKAITFLSTCVPNTCGGDSEWETFAHDCRVYGIKIADDGTISAARRMEFASMGGVAVLAGMAVVMNGV